MDDFYLAPGSPTDGSDYIVTATALSGKVRALAVRSTELVKEALRIHKTSPVATAALGRFLTGTLFVADTLKGEGDTITANIRSDGPLQGMTAVADSHGNVRGYCLEPVVETTYHRPGKLNVGAAVGSGKLTVVKDFGLKEPYVGQVELISGEIAEDFTYYFASSEQTPSIVSLGVSLDTNGVTCAGGFMVQLLPGADEETISYLEDRVNGGFPEVSFLLQEGMNPEKILDMFLGDKDICFLEGRKVAYKCNCLECHFCDQRYHFSQEDVKALISDDSE